MSLFNKTLEEMYRIQVQQMSDRNYCNICHHDGGPGVCEIDTITQCPVVVVELLELEAGLWGIKEYKATPWLKL